jgi:hypothetical protein
MRIKLLLFFTLICFGIKSQIAYTFNALNGAYVANATSTVLIPASTDDQFAVNTAIGFTFNYGCVNYTRFRASSNGWMTFNVLGAGTGVTNDLANTAASRPTLAPLWDDLRTDATGNVNYLVTGLAPNRVLTVEWRNMNWAWSAGGPVISFQVKLYETTNRIEYIYLQNGTAVVCNGASIGLSGTAVGDYYSLNNSGAAPVPSKVFETTTICTKPATNQVYRWDPLICAGAPTAGNAVASPSVYCSTFNSTLSLSGNTQGCGITYQWFSAPAAVGPYTSIANATLATQPVTVTATTYYRCVVTCTSAALSATSSVATGSLTGTGPCPLCNIRQIPALPYSQVGQTTCGEINDITSANASQVCGSTLYYGGEDVVYSFTPTATGAITVNVNTTGSFLGITLYQGCPILGGTCQGASQSAGNTASLCANVTAGQTYFLVIDSWPTPACNPYNMNISAPGPCVGSIASVTAAATATSGCAPVNSIFSTSGTSACGATYQWQAAPAAVGPYTNIIGATNATYNATLTSSAFYRCLLTCGASTAASTVIQTTITPAPIVPCALSTYTAATTTYNFEVFAGTVLPTTDDILFNSTVNLGFQFCYGGASYWGGYVASNGAFVLDCVPCYPNIGNATCATGGLGTGFTIPSPAPVFGTSIPRNAILAPWQDIDPSLGGTIRYYTTGVAPNRRFVVSYESIPMFSCGTASPSIYFTGQIKLFETSNSIEIHVGNKGVCPGFNGGKAVMGLHSYDGTIYIPPVNATAHNSPTQWSMTNTAYQFQSPCAVNSGPCAVLPIAFKNFYGENISTVNKLTWETAEEKGVKEFIIERSTDGINFYQIGAQMPNNKPSKYIYNDNTFKSSIVNYYRITGIEDNNEKKSTYIVPIGSSFDALTVSEIFPNPTENSFSISFTSKNENNLIIKIKDMYGREVKNSHHNIGVGVSQVFIDCNGLNSGVYIVEVVDSNAKAISQQKLAISK